MTRPADAAPLEETQEQQIARLNQTVWVVECTTHAGGKFSFCVAGIEMTDLKNELDEYQKEKQIWSGLTYSADMGAVSFFSIRQKREKLQWKANGK